MRCNKLQPIRSPRWHGQRYFFLFSLTSTFIPRALSRRSTVLSFRSPLSPSRRRYRFERETLALRARCTMFVERAAVTIANGTLFGPRLNAFDRYLATAAGVLRRRAHRLRLRLGIGFTLASDQLGRDHHDSPSRAANGQAAAPPSSAMNSRRFIRSPRRRGRAGYPAR